MFRFIAACAVVLAYLSPAAAQDKRVALVIGNAAYANAAPMKTALNDANDIGAALARMGFAVTRVNDATRDSMNNAIDGFRNKVKTADVALVFYAGHAIQRDGVNWLIPVDGKVDTIAGVTASAVNLDRVTGTLADVGQVGVVLLDAPRDDPFPAANDKRPPARGATPAAQAPAAQKDLLLVFATSAGRKTIDGGGRNSPFTAALLKHIETPGQEITLLTRHLRDEVAAATGGKQIPASYAITSGDRHLTPR
jgi:uncharacterized caspase-like protein